MIRLGEHEFRANLIILDIQDFDAILGMDWLASHHATVDCFKKEVVFNKPGEMVVKFCGERRVLPSCVISTIDARRLLRKGCSAYLAHIIVKCNTHCQDYSDCCESNHWRKYFVEVNVVQILMYSQAHESIVV